MKVTRNSMSWRARKYARDVEPHVGSDLGSTSGVQLNNSSGATEAVIYRAEYSSIYVHIVHMVWGSLELFLMPKSK